MATKNSINNKTGPLTVTDSTDPTKQAAFVVSAISGSTTRTLTMDDRNIDFDAVPTSITTDDGSCVASGGVFSVLGSGSLSTSAVGSVLTVTDASSTSGFLLRLSTSAQNITGDFTEHLVPFQTTVFDIGGDTAGGIFTAPQNGKYLLIANVRLYNLDDSSSFNDGYVTIRTTARDYVGNIVNPYASRDSGDNLTFSISIIADMDLGATASVFITVGDATKTVGLTDNDVSTTFSGWMLG